ncbi:MAG: NAD(P)H-hydrate dehydratase, partial [Pseudomonadota bacterium]
CQHRSTTGHHPLADADALFWLADAGTWTGGPLYLTPHSAEASRLLDVPVPDLERDRLQYAQLLRERFDAVAALLKGPGSVITAADWCWVCAHGNPGMATAGMGDVLAGVAGGMLAGCYRAGQDADACAQAFAGAVALHSAAGDIAAERVGQISLLASDVVEALPVALRTP